MKWSERRCGKCTPSCAWYFQRGPVFNFNGIAIRHAKAVSWRENLWCCTWIIRDNVMNAFQLRPVALTVNLTPKLIRSTNRSKKSAVRSELTFLLNVAGGALVSHTKSPEAFSILLWIWDFRKIWIDYINQCVLKSFENPQLLKGDIRLHWNLLFNSARNN